MQEGYFISLSGQLRQTLASLSAFAPEVACVAAFSVLLLFDVLFTHRRKTLLLTLLSLALWLAVGLVFAYTKYNITGHASYFQGMMVLSPVLAAFKLLCWLALFPAILIMAVQQRPGELFYMVWAMVVGACLLLSSAHYLPFFVSFELLALSSYLFISFGRGKVSASGAIRYVLYGAAIAGIMVYGISLLYGFSGSLYFAEAGIASGTPYLAVIGMALVLAGLFFKVSGAPFHFWVPGALAGAGYEGGLLLSYLPKAAGFLVLMHLMPFTGSAGPVLVGMAALLSLLIGNFAALVQSNVKRLMAFSGVGQAGYLLAALLPGNNNEAFFFYLAAYSFMIYGTFYLLSLMQSTAGSDNIADLRGMGRRSPFYAVLLTVNLLTLAGMPFTSGFTAKFMLFSSLWQHYGTQGTQLVFWVWLAALACIPVGFFYYLRLPYYMFFKNDTRTSYITPAPYEGAVALMLTLPNVVIFFMPEQLMQWLKLLT